MEKFEIAYLKGSSSKALMDINEEINRLTRSINNVNIDEPSKSSASTIHNLYKNKIRISNALVVAGSWTANSRSEPAEVVLDYFSQAKKYGQSREAPFYVIAKHYDSLLQASLNADQDLTIDRDNGINLSQNGSGIGSSGRLTSRRLLSSNNNSSQSIMDSHIPEDGYQYISMVIKSYAKLHVTVTIIYLKLNPEC